MIIYYRDNSKFPDTIVYHIKHTDMLLYRTILELQKPKIHALLYRDNYRYQDNFIVHYRHYRDIGFFIITQL